MRRFTTIGLALVALALTPAAVAGSSFVVGFDDDLPLQVGSTAVTPATSLGAKAFRYTLQWAAGETALTTSDAASLSNGVAAAGALRVVLSVYGTSGAAAPTDAAGRSDYCAYLHDAVTRFPAIRDVVVWNEPNKNLFWNPQTNAPALYETLLAQCYDVLHPLGVNVVGLALSSTGNDNASSTSPGAFIRGVGTAYRASGRATPILDTVGFHPYPASSTERPWAQHIGSTTIGEGDWNKLMYNLWLAFDGTGQALPGSGGVTIWYLEDGFQTTVPAAESANYSGAENVTTLPDVGGPADPPSPSSTSAAPDQATQILDAVRLAACQPYVGAFFNFMLVDDPVLSGWQSGAYWSDLTAKGSAPAFAEAFAEATGGTVDCTALKGGDPSGDYLPPSAPTAVAAQTTSSPLAVTVTWAASSDDSGGPLTYRVYRNGTWVGTTTSTSWTNTSVVQETSYTYTVRALDAAGNLGDASTAVAVTTPDVTSPSTPGALTARASADGTSVELDWQPATDDVGVAGYLVSRDGTTLATASGTSYTDVTVTQGSTYGYTVVALDAAGNASGAATVQASVPVLPTQQPSVSPSPSPSPAPAPAAAPPVAVAAAVPPPATPVVVAPAAPAAPAPVPAPVPAPAPAAPASPHVRVFHHPLRAALSWRPSAGASSYRVYRGGRLVATARTAAWTDRGVRSGVRYRHTIVAVARTGRASRPARVTLTVR